MSLGLYDNGALTDLNDIHIDKEKPAQIRALEFIEQVKNPYLFKVGDIIVSVIYCGEKDISDAMASVIKAS